MIPSQVNPNGWQTDTYDYFCIGHISYNNTINYTISQSSNLGGTSGNNDNDRYVDTSANFENYKREKTHTYRNYVYYMVLLTNRLF